MARKSIRGAAAALALALLAPLLTGCWDRVEPEDVAYATTIAVDKGENARLTLTARIAIVGGLEPGHSPGSGPTWKTVTAQAGTITEAMHVLNGGLARRVDLRHLRGFVVGEPLAHDGLEAVVMELIRNQAPRETVIMEQARGLAMDAVKAEQPVLEANPAKLEEDWLLQDKKLHMSPPIRLQQFVMRLAASGGDPILTMVGVNPQVQSGAKTPRATAPSASAGQLPRVGGDPVEEAGTAIFRRDRLAGFINVDETQMLLALRHEMGKAYVSFPDPDVPDQSVTMRFHQENFPRITATMRGGRPYVQVGLLFDGELLAAPGGTDYTAPEARRRLERAANTYAETTCRTLLAKLQKWEADPVNFGLYFRPKFISWTAWQQFDWGRRVKDLQVDVVANMRVRRFGLRTGGDRINGQGKGRPPFLLPGGSR